MNWKRGLFRVWLVGSVVWIGLGLYLFADGFTAVREVRVRPVDYVCTPSPCPPEIINEYACILYSKSGRTCTYEPLSYIAPDENARMWTFVKIVAPPVTVPILGLALFWAGRIAVRIGIWVLQGFGHSSREMVGQSVKAQSEIGLAEGINTRIASRSLLWPVGNAPWVVAVVGFGIGVDKAVDMARQAGTYGTGEGDFFVILAGVVSGMVFACVFVLARATWRLMQR